jgi:CheY-like chemotaxis protein/HPt (histidine-containing phosphotransfer) domain-containing protein
MDSTCGKILIAEDHKINQEVFRQQLALLGKSADIADDGREALKLWESGHYAILFADLHMPEMDGYELTVAIRTAEKENNLSRMPIIAFTANDFEEVAEHCLALGMDDYLCKPVKLTSLKVLLEKWLPTEVKPEKADNTDGDALKPKKEVSFLETMGIPAPKSDSGHADIPAAPLSKGGMPIDVDVLKASIGNDEEMIKELLADFRLSTAKIAEELYGTCAAKQTTAAGALAHKLKSSSRLVGAMVLGEICAAMEKAGNHDDLNKLNTLLPNFKRELVKVEEFCDEY